MNFDNYFLLIKQRFVKRTKLNMNYHLCVFLFLTILIPGLKED